jgi:hypothetical protein
MVWVLRAGPGVQDDCLPTIPVHPKRCGMDRNLNRGWHQRLTCLFNVLGMSYSPFCLDNGYGPLVVDHSEFFRHHCKSPQKYG